MYSDKLYGKNCSRICFYITTMRTVGNGHYA